MQNENSKNDARIHGTASHSRYKVVDAVIPYQKVDRITRNRPQRVVWTTRLDFSPGGKTPGVHLQVYNNFALMMQYSILFIHYQILG